MKNINFKNDNNIKIIYDTHALGIIEDTISTWKLDLFEQKNLYISYNSLKKSDPELNKVFENNLKVIYEKTINQLSNNDKFIFEQFINDFIIDKKQIVNNELRSLINEYKKYSRIYKTLIKCWNNKKISDTDSNLLFDSDEYSKIISNF